MLCSTAGEGWDAASSSCQPCPAGSVSAADAPLCTPCFEGADQNEHDVGLLPGGLTSRAQCTCNSPYTGSVSADGRCVRCPGSALRHPTEPDVCVCAPGYEGPDALASFVRPGELCRPCAKEGPHDRHP